jgi:signal peptidase I
MQQESTIPQTPNRTQPSADPSPERKHEGWKSVVSTLLIIIAAPLIAFALTAFVFQSYEVEGDSMEQTLQSGDRLIVLKTGKSWSRLRSKHYMPKRGDIVVFEKSDSVSAHDETERQLIKRVIGLPGDRVVVQDGKITVFNDEFPEGFNPDSNQPFSENIAKTTPGRVDIPVPEGEIFVCGDNRSNSLDSRSFGTIATSDVVGVLSLRIYPFSKFDHF